MPQCNHKEVGLGQITAVDVYVVSLVVLPEQTKRQDVCCPSIECRFTDDIYNETYGFHVAQCGMSQQYAILLPALEQSLQSADIDGN